VAKVDEMHFDVLPALQHEQVADLERLAAVADVEQAVARDRALVDAEDAHLADIRVDGDLEHMRDDVLGRVRLGMKLLRLGTFALEKLRRVALGRVGQQPVEHVQQFGHAGAIARGGEADRDQMPFAQRLLQRGVQFARVHITVVQIALDKIGVHLDHLFDQRTMRQLHR
jgi:hypothetical protein